jgi:hypothetical protein
MLFIAATGEFRAEGAIREALPVIGPLRSFRAGGRMGIERLKFPARHGHRDAGLGSE